MTSKLLNLYLNVLNIKTQAPSLKLVKEIQEKHLAAFSFNNIAVLLGKEISLEIEDVALKIVTKGLGGYCFEHNTLMYEVLKALGFEVRLLVGKVLNNQNIEPPRTHRITLLSFEDEDYLVDVGFGAYCPTEPIKIANISSYKTHRLIKEGKNYTLQLPAQSNYFTLYEFDLDTYTQADCVMGNFYSSNYKDAVFVNNLVVSLIQKERTLSLRNNTYHRIKKEATQVIQVGSADDLYEIITKDFGIALSLEECKVIHQEKKEVK